VGSSEGYSKSSSEGSNGRRNENDSKKVAAIEKIVSNEIE
jgi:hypothetical protein